MSPTGSVLTVMAHPDDAELWAGGTLAIHAQAGAPVTITIPRTNGVRDREATVGAQTLGAALRLLDELTADALRGLLTELRPEVVITHHVDDIHPEHQQTAQTLLTAVPPGGPRDRTPTPGLHLRRISQLRQDGRPLHLPVIVDVTRVWETKMRALAEHGSQPIAEHFGPMAQTLRRSLRTRTSPGPTPRQPAPLAPQR